MKTTWLQNEVLTMQVLLLVLLNVIAILNLDLFRIKICIYSMCISIINTTSMSLNDIEEQVHITCNMWSFVFCIQWLANQLS